MLSNMSFSNFSTLLLSDLGLHVIFSSSHHSLGEGDLTFDESYVKREARVLVRLPHSHFSPSHISVQAEIKLEFWLTNLQLYFSEVFHTELKRYSCFETKLG